MGELLKDKVAVVTGASRGIGEATALTLAQAGADVIVTARNGDELAALAERLARDVYKRQAQDGQQAVDAALPGAGLVQLAGGRGLGQGDERLRDGCAQAADQPIRAQGQ